MRAESDELRRYDRSDEGYTDLKTRRTQQEAFLVISLDQRKVLWDKALIPPCAARLAFLLHSTLAASQTVHPADSRLHIYCACRAHL